MKFTFQQKNFPDWLNAFAAFLKLPVKDHMLKLKGSPGNGWIYADWIDRSFSFVAMDIHLLEETTFHRKTNYKQGLLIFFNQVKVNRYFSISSGGKHIIDHKKERNNIYITSTNTDVEFTFPAGTQIRRLGIYLSPQWLSSHLGTNENMTIHLLKDENLEKLDKFQLNDEILQKLNLIFNTSLEDEASREAIKTHVILLLEYLFSGYFNDYDKSAASLQRKAEDRERLRAIEVLLSNEQTESFPSISNLSRIALMSSTKLKQRFKEVYGYGLYEFFNKQRLEKAAEWLKQGVPVKQVAYQIGYRDVSNFTKAFKKNFNITPAKMQQSSKHDA